MTRQRQILVTVTYNDLGCIIDTKAEPYEEPNVQPTCNNLATDCISRQALCEYALSQKDKSVTPNDIMRFPSAQPELTDDRAIEHLQSTGWMQNHDKEMYEMGLKEQLADDSGSYDSLIPCEDAISRQAAIDAIKTSRYLVDAMEKIIRLPSAQSEEVTPHRNYKYLSDYWCECGNHLGKKGSVTFCSDCGRKVKWDE